MISLRELGSEISTPSDTVEIGHTGVLVYRLNNSQDERGALSIVDFAQFKPFLPRRVFFSFDVPKGQTRGHHAHKKCLQFFVCVGGECSVEVSNGIETHQIRLDSAIYGISLPTMIWSSQYDFSENATLLVLASEPYSEDDYLRDPEEFRKAVENPT